MLAIFSILFGVLFFNKAYSQIEIHGHRGARGLAPENTIPGFFKAIEHQVTSIELDVVITKDRQVLVSHEPWISSEICLDSMGQLIPTNKEKQYNIFKLNYSEIVNFDCGSKSVSRFPMQAQYPVHKPLLVDVIIAIERHCAELKLPPVSYNIEIKSTLKGDGVFHPEIGDFCDLVYQVIKEQNITNRVTIQSFDLRAIKHFKTAKYPVKLSVLVEKDENIDLVVEQLGFKPHYYSPDYKLVNKELMTRAKKLNIKVLPWTVNSLEEMEKLQVLGVSGIITDYPDIAKQLLQK